MYSRTYGYIQLGPFSRNVLFQNVNITYLKLFCSRIKTHYETLNLPTNCTSKDIKAAFILLSKQYHPDKNKGNTKAQESFVKISEAYKVLIKPESRRDYDLTLNQNSSYSRNTNPHQTGFYEVHRHHNIYRDPWKDPSFARNRDFSQTNTNEDEYYGMKGIKRQTNERIRSWLIMVFFAAFILQIIIIRMSVIRNINNNDRRSEENRQYLNSVRERAELLGTKERQIDDFKQRLALSSQRE